VTLSNPTNNATIKNGATLTASMTDDNSGPQKIEFYRCTGNVTCNHGAGSPTLIGTNSSPMSNPTGDLSITWNSQPADGTYTLFAKGYDNAGNTTDSSSVVVTVDNTAPTFTSAALSSPSPAANLYLGSITGLNSSTASGNLYYKGNNGSGSSFNLQVGLADSGGSNLSTYSFPALGGTTTGWTHTAQTNTSTSGTSATVTSANSFSYANNTTSAATETVAVADASGNTGSLALTFTNDTTGPTVSMATPSGGANVGAGQVLTASTSDSGSGLGSVSYYYCAGAQPTCSSGAGSPTLIGTSSTASSYSVTWSSPPSSGSYKLFAKSTDNVGNSTDSSSITVTLDSTAPTASITTPAASQTYSPSTLSNLTTISGTASDTGGSNLSTVTVKIQSPNGNCWNNTSHTWASCPVQNAGGGPASWSLSLSSFTSDGDARTRSPPPRRTGQAIPARPRARSSTRRLMPRSRR